jgi:endogenous inhibitor of DNA gyrase (YacG/DUF329 family)
VNLQPTVPGKFAGIIATDPLTVQCAACGETAHRTTESTDALFLMLSGYRFHTCERHERPHRRLCPPCLAAVVAECPNIGRHR